MKVVALLLLCSLPSLTAHAQLKTGGLGGSSLNRRPSTPVPTIPVAPLIGPPVPVAPATPPTAPAPETSSRSALPPPSNLDPAKGIVLPAGWDKRVTRPARHANRDMADLRACLESYGRPLADLGLHPDAEVFPGVRYLSPLKTVEAALSRQLGGSLGLATEFTIATEGFPLGLKFRKYDRGSLGTSANKYIYLLVDDTNRVIATAFTGRGAPVLIPPGFVPPPFIQVAGDLSRDDLIDKSDGGARASVSDTRGQGKFVIVYLQGTRNLTWYVPEPLINLILYCSKL